MVMSISKILLDNAMTPSHPCHTFFFLKIDHPFIFQSKKIADPGLNIPEWKKHGVVKTVLPIF